MELLVGAGSILWVAEATSSGRRQLPPSRRRRLHPLGAAGSLHPRGGGRSILSARPARSILAAAWRRLHPRGISCIPTVMATSPQRATSSSAHSQILVLAATSSHLTALPRKKNCDVDCCLAPGYNRQVKWMY